MLLFSICRETLEGAFQLPNATDLPIFLGKLKKNFCAGGRSAALPLTGVRDARRAGFWPAPWGIANSLLVS